MRRSRRAGITHHDIAAGNAHVGVGDSGIGKAHSRRAALFVIRRRGGISPKLSL